MKKVLSVILAIVFALSFATLSAFAYTPEDGDVTVLFGSGIEIDSATEDGIPLKFVPSNGAMWSGRATLDMALALDGLSFTLKDVKFPSYMSQLFVSFASEAGGWIDGQCFMFAFTKCSGNVGAYESVGNIKHGVVYGIQDYDLAANYAFVPFTQLDKPLSGDMTFSVKKNANDWTVTINGQAFKVPNSVVKKQCPDPERVYLNFGFDGLGNTSGDFSFTLGEVKASNLQEADLPALPPSTSSTAPQKPVASSAPDKAPASSAATEAPASSAATEAPASSAATEAPASSAATTESDDTSAPADDTSVNAGSNNNGGLPPIAIVAIVIVVLIVIAAAVFCVLFILKKKK